MTIRELVTRLLAENDLDKPVMLDNLGDGLQGFIDITDVYFSEDGVTIEFNEEPMIHVLRVNKKRPNLVTMGSVGQPGFATYFSSVLAPSLVGRQAQTEAEGQQD